MDAVGSNIRVDARGREVLRILPRINDDVNEEWISDKTRYVAMDGLRTQRLDRPYVRKEGKLVAGDAGTSLQSRSPPSCKLASPAAHRAIAGDLVRCRGDVRAEGPAGASARRTSTAARTAPRSIRLGRGSYLFNPTIDGIEQADAILLVGTNPRLEAPVLNARIRKR